MAQYRHVGTASFKEGHFNLDRFGQTIELTDEQARIEIGYNNLPVIPAALFAELFTDEEVKKHPTLMHQANMDAAKKPDFEARRAKAWTWPHEFRMKVQADSSTAVETPQEVA